jgi:hypothetical protein
VTDKKDSQRDAERNPDELFGDREFVQEVAEHGYKWQTMPYLRGIGQRPEGPAPLLIESEPFGDTKRAYTPLTEPNLFRAFAELNTDTRQPLLEFANRWGCLGKRVYGLLPPSRPGGEQQSVYGERLDEWMRAIWDMCAAVEMWDAVSNGNRKTIQKHIKYEPAQSYKDKETGNLIRTVGGWWYSPGATHIESPSREIPANDPMLAASIYVQQAINSHIFAATGPLLLRDAGGRQVFRLVPMSLLGALWLQFARVIAGDVSYNPCEVCGKILTISNELKGGRRRDSSLCSVACKQKSHRRKVKARELRAAGGSITAIAKQFQVPPSTIKRWLTKEK